MTLKKGGPVWTILRWYGYSEYDLLYGKPVVPDRLVRLSLCKVFWSIIFGLVVLWPLRGAWRVLRAVGRAIGVILNPIGNWVVGTIDEPPSRGFFRVGLVAVPLSIAITSAITWKDLQTSIGPLTMLVAGGLVSLFWFGIAGLLRIGERRGMAPEARRTPSRSSALTEGAGVVAAAIRSARQKACPIIKFEE